MKYSVHFVKMSGAGNDFIVIDNRNNILAIKPQEFAKKVCLRNRSVGADGVLLLENSGIADFKMRILNADGSEAEMCGNGIRCISRYAFYKEIAKSNMAIETLAGIIYTQVQDENVKVKMTKPSNLKLNLKVLIESKEYELHYVNTGVPHSVLFVEDIDKINANKLGRIIRFHSIFAPAGTNVDFVYVENGNKIRIRTYERGVEAETLACGTGAVASAIISNLIRNTKFPTDVITSGKDKLIIYCNEQNNDIFMEGDADLICEGELFI